jgi:DNA-binding NarL/FixJ family response regulator
MTRSVVVVDDEPGLRSLLLILLERDGGFDVVAEAGDGVEAIEAVTQHDPDLLLLDLGLPRMDGLEVLAALQGRSRPTTVVLTGFTDEATLAEARALGASTCLVKGEGFALVTDTLRQVDVHDRPTPGS